MKTITVSDKVWNAIQSYIASHDIEPLIIRPMTESDVVELALTFMAIADDDDAGVEAMRYLGLIV